MHMLFSRSGLIFCSLFSFGGSSSRVISCYTYEIETVMIFNVHSMHAFRHIQCKPSSQTKKLATGLPGFICKKAFNVR